MKTNQPDHRLFRQIYHPPQLEAFPWLEVTGVSLPIGTTGFLDNPLDELQDTLEGEQ